MRHGTTGRRQRNNRSGRGRGNQPRTQVFDSNGPDVRIRGTAFQVAEKYEALAKDAAGAGDRILEQSYLQHAEHYQRIILSWGPDASASSKPDKKDTYTSEDGNVQPEKKQTSSRRSTRQAQDEDLGLPSSILGAGTEESLEGA